MKVDKISVSFTAQLGDDVRAAARRKGIALSSWLADAAAAKLRAAKLGSFLDDWERQFGPISADELKRAESDLGVRKKRRRP